tara:strand:+ start:31 stop:360 length:330 start_codon:yes stop_codon:yes gene_type:complete
MSLSKKNLDKLNNFIKNNDLDKDRILNKSKNAFEEPKRTNNPVKSEDPSKIFYSLIDNSECLSETSKVNHLLRSSENDLINKNYKNANHQKHLTIEEELYDEFNYLLEE